MLAGFFSFVEKLILFVCIVGILFFRNIAKEDRKKASPQSQIKERLETQNFVLTNAVFVSRESKVWDEEQRDLLHDHVETSWSSDSFLPFVDFSTYEKGYKEVHYEEAPVSKYEITVEGKTYFLLSRKRTSQTIPVYYNKDNPMEIYSAKEVEKVQNWTDAKERIYREQQADDSQGIIKFLAIIAGVILAHLVFF